MDGRVFEGIPVADRHCPQGHGGRMRSTMARLMMIGHGSIMQMTIPGFMLDYHEYFDKGEEWALRHLSGMPGW